MTIDLTTPALLFPAISLLLLAFTNRFLALANLIRSLHDRYLEHPDRLLREQIRNLRLRVNLIRGMQALGVSSMLFCGLTMFLLFADETGLARQVFGLSLILFILSLALSVYEIQISSRALDLLLRDLEEEEVQEGRKKR
jgi:hypothetical protein